MRLLHVQNLELKEFFEPSIPPYAILSHTWGSDEVTLQDLSQILKYSREGLHHTPEATAGYRKIEQACKQAEKDGFRWAWVDTCCIDKTSSAELSEAINSMFRWYQNSAICYAYLSDVEDGDVLRAADSSFRQSRWFTRGWTLQELLAPDKVIFFSKSWVTIGDLRSLYDIVEDITRISSEYLLGRSVLSASVSQKMAWASRRTTTRLEDMSYCLLGMFNVNMPLLYGEGGKAFIRLQQEIIEVSNDQTLFIWGFGHDSTETSPQDNLSGEPKLLATSPSDFTGCENIVQCNAWVPKRVASFEMTKTGLRIELPLVLCQIPDSENDRQILGLLNCRPSYEPDKLLAIPLGRPFPRRDTTWVLRKTLPANSILSSKPYKVQRFPQYSIRLVPASSLWEATFVSLSINSTRPFKDAVSSHTTQVQSGLRVRSCPAVIRPGDKLSACRRLAGDPSIEFSQLSGATNSLIREVSLAEDEACDALRTMTSAYMICDHQASQFLVRVDFLPPFAVARRLAQTLVWPHRYPILFSFVPRFSFRLERFVRCRLASIPESTTHLNGSAMDDESYLQQLQWRKSLTLQGGVSVRSEVRSYGLIHFMWTILLTTEGAPGGLRSETHLPGSNKAVSVTRLFDSDWRLWLAQKDKCRLFPTAICLVFIGLLITQSVAPWKQLGTIVVAAATATLYTTGLLYARGYVFTESAIVAFNLGFFSLFTILYYGLGYAS